MSPNQNAETSPQVYARTAGMLYLVVIVAGIFAELFVRGKLIVPGNAAATTHNIMTHGLLYRSGFAAELIACVCNMPLAVIFYHLFKRVNKNLTLLIVFLTLVGTAIESISLLHHFEPLILLSGKLSLTTEQLQALTYTSLQLFEYGFSIALVFFGIYCLTIGYLIIRSALLPRIIGVMLAIEGLCYLVNSFGNFLAPEFAAHFFPFLAVSGLAEISLCLWLLVKGVNVEKWNALAH